MFYICFKCVLRCWVVTVTYPAWLGQPLQAFEADDRPDGGGGGAECRGSADGGEEAGHGANGNAGHLDDLERRKTEWASKKTRCESKAKDTQNDYTRYL